MASTISVKDQIDPRACVLQAKEALQDSSHAENDRQLQGTTICEEDGLYQYEDEEMPPGCISVKDFAYTLEDPLHYGFYSDTEEYDEEAYGGESDEYDEHDPNSVLQEYYENDDDDEDEDNKTNHYQEHDQGNEYSQDKYFEDFDRRKSYIMPSEHIINRKAIALYDFENENENELGLQEGQVVFIDYRHGQGWLVVETMDGMHTGLVPEDYLQILDEGKEDEDADAEAHNGFANEYADATINNTVVNNTLDETHEDCAKRPDYLAGLFDVEQGTGHLPSNGNNYSSHTSLTDPLNEDLKTLSIH